MAQDDSRRVGRLRIDAANRDEAAAIAAAITEYLNDKDGTNNQDGTDDQPESWNGKRFEFAGRIRALTGVSRRVPRNAPTDEWTTAGRVDRFER